MYIEKKNSKKQRPLGIPTFTDKLIQEAVRLILESIYEPVFEDVSHGFRPQRSYHTALKTIKREFGGARWFVEGDIKGCFDNIDHGTLIGLINLKIKDMKMSKLIYKFLKAGYLENWQYHKTYSGTPQGGILSPLLANIYLHELDKFVLQLKKKFDQESPERITPEYRELHNKKNLSPPQEIGRLRKKLSVQHNIGQYEHEQINEPNCINATDRPSNDQSLQPLRKRYYAVIKRNSRLKR